MPGMRISWHESIPASCSQILRYAEQLKRDSSQSKKNWNGRAGPGPSGPKLEMSRAPATVGKDLWSKVSAFGVELDPFGSRATARASNCPFRTEHRDSADIYWVEFQTLEDVEEALEEEAEQGFAVEWCACVECAGSSDRYGGGNVIPLGSLEPNGDDDALFGDCWWFRKNAQRELQSALAQAAENTFRLGKLAGKVHHAAFAAMREQWRLDLASAIALRRQIVTLQTERISKSR